jgi:DNA-binding response OmpR family regulator
MTKPAGHLLIVDDEAANRDMLARRLAKQGYTFELAAGGAEALALLASSQFDVVLLDVQMPVISGFKVLANIRKSRSLIELPVILVTARAESADIANGLERGANDYITKPIDFPVALARIRNQQALKNAESSGRERNNLARSLREMALRSVSEPRR